MGRGYLYWSRQLLNKWKAKFVKGLNKLPVYTELSK